MDPFDRIKNILSLSSPESYLPQTNKIPGEKFLSKYEVNKSTVVENPTELYFIAYMNNKARNVKHIEIMGAETNKGRWVAYFHFSFYNSGGGGFPLSRQMTKQVEAFGSKEAAIIFYMQKLIGYCDRENSALSRKCKSQIIKDRDELLISMS